MATTPQNSTAEVTDTRKELPVDRYLDRELSWLDFNQRVLELAEDKDLYLMERAKFLAIFTSNLDEFFMVRVAGLKRRIATGLAVPSNSGIAPLDMLDAISGRAHELMHRQSEVFHKEILPGLAAEGISLLRWDQLTTDERNVLTTYFENQIFPVLTPLAVDPAHPFPYISGLSLNIAVVVHNEKSEKDEFARVKVPQSLPRLIRIPGSESTRAARFISVEDVIMAHLESLFPGMTIVEAHVFRITRNEDVQVEEDEAEDLLQALEKELLRRRFGPPVRLEVTEDISPAVRELLVNELEVHEKEVYDMPAPLDFTAMWDLMSVDRPDLLYPVAVPTTNPDLRDIERKQHSEFFTAIRRNDILLHHPYESFATSVQAFLAHAAADKHVLAIKQTLYRTSGDSPIIDALIGAAQNGKQVLALVEIKARFDEENNISWARKLEKAGVHVVYGLVGLKTHCKLSLVIREEEGKLRRYCHVGTGNYNPKTARLYEDMGLLTCSPDVGDDLSRLFNQLSGYSIDTGYARLLVAPHGLRKGLLKLIETETAHAEAGKPARIRIKVNALVDEQIIDALYRANNAGVKVEIWVRGMCALKAGQPGYSENITVRSILGRYLEHSRVFWFDNDGDTQVFIGSADMMHRNLDRRVEALVRLIDPSQKKEIDSLFNKAMDPGTSSWYLGDDGKWIRHSKAADGTQLRDLQADLIAQATERKLTRKRTGE